MAQRYCRACGGWHDLDQPWPSKCWREVKVAQSDLPVPRIISDTMEPVQSMVDGRIYTSKAKIRASYRAAGVVEVGNDPQRMKPKAKTKPDRNAIRQSVRKAFEMHASGVRPH